MIGPKMLLLGFVAPIRLLRPLSPVRSVRGISTSPPTTLNTSQSLTWPEFFKLRRRRLLIQRVAGIPFTLGFLTAEGTVLSLPIFDPTQTMFGIDPFVMIGLGTVAGIVISYSAGTAITGLLWRRIQPQLAAQLNKKQKDFYARISKYRANVPPNPTQINFSFDYYGEKIRSITDYRHWLRRQHQLREQRQFKI